MAKVNVYLPDDLERRVREAGLPLSAVCQAAVAAALDDLARLRADTPTAARMTGRLTSVIAAARSRHQEVSAFDLLGAIVLHGENLGARVLRSLGVDLPAPATSGPRSSDAAPAGRLADDAQELLLDAFRVAVELRHPHLGTEHVVIAAASAATTRDLFAALGIDASAAKRSVERLLTNPWVVDPPDVAPSPPAAELVERVEGELARLAAEVERLRSALPRER